MHLSVSKLPLLVNTGLELDEGWGFHVKKKVEGGRCLGSKEIRLMKLNIKLLSAKL